VVSGATFKNKADIERIIIECGGSVVQNPGNEFHLVNIYNNITVVLSVDKIIFECLKMSTTVS